MPRAVIDTTTERHDLRTCPGGYVELKRMPYGDWLHRTDISMQMQMQMEERRQRRSSKSEGTTGTMKLMNQAVTIFEFSRCIVDHNLEDANDQPLNFKRPEAFAQLDPRVGNEIGDLIKNMHEFEEEDEGNS